MFTPGSGLVKTASSNAARRSAMVAKAMTGVEVEARSDAVVAGVA